MLRLQNCCHAPGRDRQWPVSTCNCKTNCYCTFQAGCQENREKPEITEPTNPIQCRPHDLALEWQCGLHWIEVISSFYLFAYGPMTTILKCTVHWMDGYFRIYLFAYGPLTTMEPEMYSQFKVNLVKLATDKTLDFYYTVNTSDLHQRIVATNEPLLVAKLTVQLGTSIIVPTNLQNTIHTLTARHGNPHKTHMHAVYTSFLVIQLDVSLVDSLATMHVHAPNQMKPWRAEHKLWESQLVHSWPPTYELVLLVHRWPHTPCPLMHAVVHVHIYQLVHGAQLTSLI